MKVLSAQIGELITELRKARGLSQEEVAFNTGISEKAMSKLENSISEPRLKTAMNIAYALNMKPSELMEEIEKHLKKKGQYFVPDYDDE